jgi:hypothetical protein
MKFRITYLDSWKQEQKVVISSDTYQEMLDILPKLSKSIIVIEPLDSESKAAKDYYERTQDEYDYFD